MYAETNKAAELGRARGREMKSSLDQGKRQSSMTSGVIDVVNVVGIIGLMQGNVY